jgi:8-oxo-dGTP pyrophosphatase MutT (NUDIX family)
MSEDAIPAATLIAVRERAGGAPELLMVERGEGMAFAAGALVFPGGRIDEADRQLAAAIGHADSAAAVAAIRETIEETAIPIGLAPLLDQDTALGLQRELVEGGDLAAAIGARGVQLDLSALTPFARWVPKFHAVRRFDTLFFLARAPESDWEPRIVAGECSGACWITAQEVLDRDCVGTARLIFPTRRTLERLAQHASFAAMIEDAKSHPIEAVTPWVEERGGERYITIPAHLGFPVTQEKLDGLWRG